MNSASPLNGEPSVDHRVSKGLAREASNRSHLCDEVTDRSTMATVQNESKRQVREGVQSK